MGPVGQNEPPKIRYYSWMDLNITSALQGKHEPISKVNQERNSFHTASCMK